MLFSVNSFAGETNTIDTGDTAWVLISSAMVLLMTMPALGLFYGGMVKKKIYFQLFIIVLGQESLLVFYGLFSFIALHLGAQI